MRKSPPRLLFVIFVLLISKQHDMKKILFVIAAVLALGITSCSDDDEKGFAYDLQTLYGTWQGTAVKVEGEWIDISSPLMSKYQFSATFYDDGTYYGEGFFGTGRGTYKAVGKNVVTYVDKKEYARYTILSLSDTAVEMRMKIEGESFDIRCKKK